MLMNSRIIELILKIILYNFVDGTQDNEVI